MGKKFPWKPKKEKLPAKELFATQRDIEIAERIVAEECGTGMTVNYTGLPKNIGVKGDTGVRAHSVLIDAQDQEKLRTLLSEEGMETLGKVAIRIPNESDPVTKVLIDLTLLADPEAGPLEADHSEVSMTD